MLWQQCCGSTCRQLRCASHLVVDVVLVDMAPVHDELEHLSVHVDVHALELARLVVAALVAVKGQEAQLLQGGVQGVRLAWGGAADVDLHLRGHLRAAAGCWQVQGATLGVGTAGAAVLGVRVAGALP